MTYLDARHGFVVHGDGGLDELSLSGPSEIAVVHSDGRPLQSRQYRVTPEELGIEPAPLSALAGGGDATENAAILRRVLGLDGERAEPGPKRDVVVLNAAAVLVVAGLAHTLHVGAALATQAIETGAVEKLVAGLRRG